MMRLSEKIRRELEVASRDGPKVRLYVASSMHARLISASFSRRLCVKSMGMSLDCHQCSPCALRPTLAHFDTCYRRGEGAYVHES